MINYLICNFLLLLAIFPKEYKAIINKYNIKNTLWLWVNKQQSEAKKGKNWKLWRAVISHIIKVCANVKKWLIKSNLQFSTSACYLPISLYGQKWDIAKKKKTKIKDIRHWRQKRRGINGTAIKNNIWTMKTIHPNNGTTLTISAMFHLQD